MNHALPIGCKQQAAQQRWVLVSSLSGPLLSLVDERLHAIPQILRNDAGVLRREVLALVTDFTKVQAIAKQTKQVLLINRATRTVLAGLGDPGLGTVTFDLQFAYKAGSRTVLCVPTEDVLNQTRLSFVDQQLAINYVVTQRGRTAHPHTLGFAGCDLVSDAFSRDLTFKLSKGQQNVERQPPHRSGRVELLGDRDERDVVPIEHLNQLRKVRQAAREAVDLVDHHDINFSGLDVCHQALESWTINVAAGESTIVVGVVQRQPTFMALATHKSKTCIALCFQAVVLLIQAFIG